MNVLVSRIWGVGGSLHNVYVYQIITYTLNVYLSIYLNKVWKIKEIKYLINNFHTDDIDTILDI